jgi:hypothetical protein
MYKDDGAVTFPYGRETGQNPAVIEVNFGTGGYSRLP